MPPKGLWLFTHQHHQHRHLHCSWFSSSDWSSLQAGENLPLVSPILPLFCAAATLLLVLASSWCSSSSVHISMLIFFTTYHSARPDISPWCQPFLEPPEYPPKWWGRSHVWLPSLPLGWGSIVCSWRGNPSSLAGLGTFDGQWFQVPWTLAWHHSWGVSDMLGSVLAGQSQGVLAAAWRLKVEDQGSGKAEMSYTFHGHTELHDYCRSYWFDKWYTADEHGQQVTNEGRGIFFSSYFNAFLFTSVFWSSGCHTAPFPLFSMQDLLAPIQQVCHTFRGLCPTFHQHAKLMRGNLNAEGLGMEVL